MARSLMPGSNARHPPDTLHQTSDILQRRGVHRHILLAINGSRMYSSNNDGPADFPGHRALDGMAA